LPSLLHLQNIFQRTIKPWSDSSPKASTRRHKASTHRHKDNTHHHKASTRHPRDNTHHHKGNTHPRDSTRHLLKVSIRQLAQTPLSLRRSPSNRLAGSIQLSELHDALSHEASPSNGSTKQTLGALIFF
jgi:hypothetical protein